MRVRRIHHVTVAVRDLDAARATFERLFGVAAGGTAEVPAFGARTAGVALGEDALQLAAPLDADTPLMRFIERRGEGFYNLAVEVEDLDEALAELAAQGVRVSEPVEAAPGVRSAFVAMAATHGLSVQLIEIVPEPSGEAPEPEPAAAAPGQLDLTPDEWSDVD